MEVNSERLAGPQRCNSGISRRHALAAIASVGVGSAAFQRALAAQLSEALVVTADMLDDAEWISGVELSEEERERVAREVTRDLRHAAALRTVAVDADTIPATLFRPDCFYSADKPAGEGMERQLSGKQPPDVEVQLPHAGDLKRPDDSELAFMSLTDQAALLAGKKISSQELTELYLERLKRYDPLLHCVVTLLEEEARGQAAEADQRIASGTVLGPLDGIPWVAKDLIAVPPHKTTWGAAPFREQVRPQLATVAQRLNAAGAVLLAKVSLGALAWGDEWFGGKTRNPWDPTEGSSGSSAGSAAAVAAGLTTFALGSETLGSIVSPCRRCRTSGLRPTYGRVSRAGCMPLAWSMDKIGPISRFVGDLPFILAPLLGPDNRDPTVVHQPFQWPEARPINELRIGLSGDSLSETEQAAADVLKQLGCKFVDIDLQSELPVTAMRFILGVEASTVFEDAFMEDPEADYGLWNTSFHKSRYIPGIQYLRAQRLRGRLITETEKKLRQVDVVLGGDDLLLTNLTGHPSLVVSCSHDGSDRLPRPGTIKLTAAAYREQTLLQVGQHLQQELPPNPISPQLREDSQP